MHKSIYTQQYKILLEVLKEARNAAGLTQADMADRLTMGQSDISKCESGARRLDLIEVKLWVEALGVDLISVIQKLEERTHSDGLIARIKF